MVRPSVPAARTLLERFCPNSGAPLRVGQVWPPRVVVHHAGAPHPGRDEVEVAPTVWVRHLLRGPVEVAIRPSDEPAVDSEGRTAEVEVGRVRAHVASGRPRSVPLAPGEDAAAWKALRLSVRWPRRLAHELARSAAWVRKALWVELGDPGARRSFQWFLYLTPGEAELPQEDLPHFRWIDDAEGPLADPGVARHWIELPAPMSSPALPPACWLQAGSDGAGPQQVSLVSTWPVEPPLPAGVEAVGWNGTLGGVDPRPAMQALAVHAVPAGGQWSATLRYWDTSPDEAGRGLEQARPTALEPPTPCVWPQVRSDDDRPLALYDLAVPAAGGPEEDTDEDGGDAPLPPPPAPGVEVKVTFRIALPDDAEGLRLERGTLQLGHEVVGRWEEGPIELFAGQRRTLRCALDLGRLRDAADGRLKLTFHFTGRPTRGVVRGAPAFRTANGPYVRLARSRAEGGVRTPWLVIDLGTEGTCAAVGFLDGFVPRVITVPFDDGPIYPSRVWLSPALGGVYALAEEPSEDALYTTLIKLGLRFGDGAHPGCPDHVAATEVARFFLKRFLLEVRERTGWFPLHLADVLVSFPPRLAAMPRFVRSLKDTFQSVLEEVVWTDREPKKLWFREEAFLVAVPAMYKDLNLSASAAGRSRYYWVMDFGGGTTDVCGFLVTPDEEGEEHVVSHLTYPQRLPHHLSGNDVTRAFYAALVHHLDGLGLVAGPDAPADDPSVARRFPVPPDPFPTARSTATALVNQAALRELADALKRLSPAEHGKTPVRTVVRSIGEGPMRTADGLDTTLLALLSTDAARLGERTVAEVHGEVLDPGRQGQDPTKKGASRCTACGSENALPLWVFASNRAFRYRCARCGQSQRVQLREAGILPDEGDEGSPVLTGWRDRTVASFGVAPGEDRELYLEQDGRTYVIRDADTLRRWIEERRVNEDDLLSEDGLSWVPLRERAELRPLFRAAEEVGVDTTQEVPRGQWQRWMFPEPAADARAGPPQLGRDIRLFLDACREALEAAVKGLPDPASTDVVVLVAGRASQFGPIADGVQAFLPGKVVHLTNDWVRRSFGNAGQIDPTADLKTMTVNGGGLFALLRSNPDTSQLLLSVDAERMDVPIYLQSGVGARPWLVSRELDLRPGASVSLVAGEPEVPVLPGETVEEPPPRPLPLDTPLTGDLQLVVDGLPEDRGWEPYVVVAQGTARRKHGRRARTVAETRLVTTETEFVLAPLSQGLDVRFARMLPRLPLLGEPTR